MGRNTRFARTVSEEDLAQADAAFLSAEEDLPATTTTTATTSTTATAGTSPSSSSRRSQKVAKTTEETTSLLGSGLYTAATTSTITTTTDSSTGAVSAAAAPSGPAEWAPRATPTLLLPAAVAPATHPSTTSDVTGAAETAAVSAAGGLTSSGPSRGARRAPRALPAAPLELPATAAQVTDLPSLLSVVNALSMTIVKAVQEGKSVTSPNKKLILLATEETRRAMAAFQRLTAPTTTSLTLTPTHKHTTTTTSIETIPEATRNAENLRRDLVSCVREEMVKLKGEIITSVTDAVRPTYAQMLNARTTPPTALATTTTTPANRRAPPHISPPVSRPAIVVSTKLPVQTRQETVTAWRNSISFRDCSYAPAKIQPISNNKLRVEFETTQHRDDALERLRGSEKVSAEPARKLQPMFILKGVTKDIPSEDILGIIKRQNPTLGVPEASQDIRLKFTRRNRNDQLYNAVFVAAPKMFRRIIELGRINIDHQKIHVEEFSPFMQCFGCLQFGHGQKYCTDSAKKPCAYCAETTHREVECPSKLAGSTPKCFNCAKRNSKFNLNQSIEHTASSNSCPVLRVMKARVDQRIDYGYF